MLRTLIVGAIAAIAGTKLKQAYDAGKLDPVIDRTRTAFNDARQRAADRGRSSATARRARPVSSADSPSRPAKAAPWPVDPRAITPN